MHINRLTRLWLVGGLVVVALAVTAIVFRNQLGTFVMNNSSSVSRNKDAYDVAFKRAIAVDTTYRKIEKAQVAGTLTRENFVLDMARAAFDPPSVPANLRGTPIGKRYGPPDAPQGAIAEAVANFSTYSTATQAELTSLLARPESESTKTTAEASLAKARPNGKYLTDKGTLNFLAHYLPGKEHVADVALATLEASLAKAQSPAIGFELPTPDPKTGQVLNDSGCFNKGPDPRFDIYLDSWDKTNDYSGLTVSCIAFGYKGAFLLITDTMDDPGTQYVANHELSHVIQFGYSLLKKANDQWLAEGSADFLALRVFDPVVPYVDPPTDDASAAYYNNVACAQSAPTYILVAPSDKPCALSYARAQFFIFSEDAGANNTFVLAMLKKMFKTGGSVEDLEATLGITVAEAFQQLDVANTFTGSRKASIPNRYVPYKEGFEYSDLQRQKTYKVSKDVDGTKQLIVGVQGLSAGHVRIAKSALFDGNTKKKFLEVSVYDTDQEGLFTPRLYEISSSRSSTVKDFPPPNASGKSVLTVNLKDTLELELSAIATSTKEGPYNTAYSLKFVEACPLPTGFSAAGSDTESCPIGQPDGGTIKPIVRASCDYQGACIQECDPNGSAACNPPPHPPNEHPSSSTTDRLACKPVSWTPTGGAKMRNYLLDGAHDDPTGQVLYILNDPAENCPNSLLLYTQSDTNNNGIDEWSCDNPYDPPCSGHAPPDFHGDPRLASVQILITSETDPNKYLRVTTNSIGEYLLGDLPPDKYHFKVDPSSKFTPVPGFEFSLDLTDPTKSHPASLGFLLKGPATPGQ